MPLDRLEGSGQSGLSELSLDVITTFILGVFKKRMD
jgi:hypothetical protein